MTWHHYLTRVSDGLLGAEIDIPSFSWTLRVSDASLQPRALRTKGVGEMASGGFVIPWTAVPGKTAAQKDAAIREGKVAITTFWKESGTPPSDLGTPMFWGVISDRTDTWADVSFSVDGIMTLLGRQLVLTEKVFSTKAETLTLSGTAQDIARRIIDIVATKPGATWPIDHDGSPNVGTDPTLTLQLSNWDISNTSAASLLTNLANIENGPDIAFRPYLADANHVRLRMLLGHPYLMQDVEHSLNTFPTGGSVQEFTITRSANLVASRVYGTGAGTGSATKRAFAEDTTLTGRSDPWPMYEATYSNSSIETTDVLQRAVNGRLKVVSKPLMQFEGTVRADGPVKFGKLYPGEITNLSVQGHPSLPDGVYRVRVMEMSGDEGLSVKVKWDVLESSY